MATLLILLLPLAAWSGWYVAMRSEARALRHNQARASYFQGLNYLLNDESDRALEAFGRLPVLDQQTLDSQLILGNLFRKRGELDRALHLHHRWYQDTQLSAAQKQAVTYELAADYEQAGMYVQAQELYEALLVAAYRVPEVSAALSRIYERLALWQKAIQLAVAPADKMAHYYCALAEEKPEESAFYLQRALETDPQCVRAYHLQAQQQLAAQKWIEAIATLQACLRFAPMFWVEHLPYLMQCYQALGRRDEGLALIRNEEAKQGKARLTLALLPYLNADEAQALLQQRLQESASPLLLAADQAHHYPEPLRHHLRARTHYQCQQCGFRHQALIWHCPACFSWSRFVPVLSLNHKEYAA